VDLEEEQIEVVKSSLEVNNGSLSKMGFTKIGGKWVSKDSDQGCSSSGVHAGQEEEDLDAGEGVGVDAQEEHATADIGAGTSVGNQGERILLMSHFERFIVNRMDNFAENKRNLHDFYATNFQNFDEKFQSMDTRFQNLDEQIEAVQNQLFELQYGKED